MLYNALANRYAYLDIPAFDPIDVHFADYGIKISFALLKGNIVYLPMLAQFDREGHILEGVGVTPDIEIDLDIKQFKATGKDTQLDCALQHIRNRK